MLRATLYSWGAMQGERNSMHTCTPCTQKAPQTKATTRKRHHKQKPPHSKGTTNKSNHPFRPTHHSQSGSSHLHSPLEQHAPLVPLSCPASAKGTTNKNHHTQKAPQTKATTRSGLPITVRVGVPICIHHLSNMHLLCLCLAQPPRQLSTQKKSVLTLLHNPQGSLWEITLRYLKEHIAKLKQSCNKVAISHIRG